MRPQDVTSETPKIAGAVSAEFLHRVRPKHSVTFEQSAQYLEQSVAAYRAALEVYTREQLPQIWATTQNNLGIVLEDLGTRSSGDQSAQYLQQSVTAYRAALEVRTREQLPQDWATTQNNLGIVLKELGTHSSGDQSVEYLEQSVAAYENALTIFTPEANPYYNEIARRNLEQASHVLIALIGGGVPDAGGLSSALVSGPPSAFPKTLRGKAAVNLRDSG